MNLDAENSYDKIIREAIQSGKFDNLPGKGKPLKLDDNPFEDPEWRLANHLLKANDFTLPWLATRQEILADLEAARADFGRAWRRSRAAKTDPVEWQRAAQRMETQIEALNKRIRDYNLSAPESRFQLIVIRYEDEISRLERQAPPEEPASAVG